MPEILFKRERICERFSISKETFYAITREPHSPIKRAAGTWVCTVEEVADWIRTLQNPQEERHETLHRYTGPSMRKQNTGCQQSKTLPRVRPQIQR